MFFASKVLALITQPLTLVSLILTLSMLSAWRSPRTSRWLLGVALAMMLLTSWKPLPEAVLRGLESRYVEMAPDVKLQGYAGVVVLGGGLESGRTQMAHVQPLLNDAGERMTAAVILMRNNPELRVLFTGGEGTLIATGQTEAERAKLFFESLGAGGNAIQYEAASRNTYENAVLTAKLSGVDPTQRWLLLTSASHMPRSMAAFAKAGWNVTAYPVDFRTGANSDWLDFSLVGGAAIWQNALHELVGIAAYRLIGRI